MHFFSCHNDETRRRSGLRPGWMLLVLILAAAVLAGCHSNPGSAGPAQAANPTQADSMVAKVNDDIITMGQLYDFMQRMPLTGAAQALQSVPQTYTVGELALLQLIQQDLVIQYAKDQGVPPTDQEIDQSFQNAELTNQVQTTWPFEQVLAKQQYTPDTYKRDVLRFQVAEFNLLTQHAQATPQEIQASYNADKATHYTVPAAVHIERVVVPTKAQADSIYQGANRGVPLASSQSENQAPATEGSDPVDIPQWLPLNSNNPGVTPVTSHLQSAKAGEVIPPFQVGSGWWVVKVLAVRPNSVLPFSQVQEAAKTNVLSQKITSQDKANVIQGLKTFEQSAAITVPPGYESLITQIKAPVPTAPIAPPMPSAPPAPNK